MRRHQTTVAHSTAIAVFLIVAGLVLAPYQDGMVTPFYGFIAAPGLLLGALASAAWLDGWLMARVSRENKATSEGAIEVASVPGIAAPYAWESHAGCCQYVRKIGGDTVRALPRRGSRTDLLIATDTSGNRISSAGGAVGD